MRSICAKVCFRILSKSSADDRRQANYSQSGRAACPRFTKPTENMTRKWSNENLPGALHFVTGNVLDRKKIFLKESACIAFMTALQELRSARKCKLAAFVLMPDHFHLTLNPEDGDIRRTCGELKSRTASALIDLFPENYFRIGEARNQVWQQSFKALPLWSDYMIKQKVDYIHANPVKAGLVTSTLDYRWSSFHARYHQCPDPLLQIDSDWWWPDDVRKLGRAFAEKQAALDAEIEEKKQRGQATLPDCEL